MSVDNRQFCRIKFAAKSVVMFDSMQAEAALVDISMKGALVNVAMQKPLQMNQRGTLAVHLDASDVVMHFDVEAIHNRDDFVGLKFVGVDIDTMIHLRSLLELNTADPDQVRHELAIFLDSKW